MGKGGKRMSHIRRNMKEENSEYRPEQLLCAKIFRELLGSEYDVKTEYPVTLTPFDGLRPRGAILDIAILGKGMKIAVRLMGAVHDNQKKMLQDQDQRTVLQANGWRVYDFSWYNMLELWDQKKHTPEEARLAIIRNFTLTGDI